MSEEWVKVKELEGWLSAGEVGENIGVSGVWVKKLAERGEIRGVKTGLGWLFDPESVRSYVEAKKEALEKKAAKMGSAYPIPKRGRERHGKTLKGGTPDAEIWNLA